MSLIDNNVSNPVGVDVEDGAVSCLQTMDSNLDLATEPLPSEVEV
jgi:hypothetical protein